MTEIRTSTAGSLPRTDALLTANAGRSFADDGFTLERSPEHDALTRAAVADVVERQRALGITFPGDGEFGKAMSNPVDYGAWWAYSFQRVNGLTLTEFDPFNGPAVRSEPGNIRLTTMADRRDRERFPRVYADPTSGAVHGKKATGIPSTTSALSYRGHDAVANDIANLKAALNDNEEGFLTAIAPASASRIRNEFYANDDEHLHAWVEALRPEYEAIVNAGLTLQLDDPYLAESWDQINPEPSVADYQAFISSRVEALNEALKGLPKEQLRLHLCWGSWHGPHTTDIEIRHILPVILKANVGQISFEAGNVRHEHEWVHWHEAKHLIPDDLVLVPGVVSHATNVVEHPDLVAQRLRHFTELVGKDRVIAATDCGLGGRIHPDIAWAKLESLGEGAQRANK